MSNIEPSSPSLSFAHFEDFIKKNPDAKNIVISNGSIMESSSVEDQDQEETKKAFKQALQEKYPNQVSLVDDASDSLEAFEETWNAYTIRHVIDQAKKNEIAPIVSHVEERGLPPESITKISEAFKQYSQELIKTLSPEQLASLQRALEGPIVATSGAAVAALLATHVPSQAANTALANLINTVSGLLPHVASTLPMEGAAAPTHLVAAQHVAVSSVLGAAASGSVQATVSIAAATAVPLIVVGAIAHRTFIATSRVAEGASEIEHEINNISTAILAAAFATIPPAQHALLLATIVASIIGHHGIDYIIVQKALHNIRDAALGVYIVNHPAEIIAFIDNLKNLLSSGAGHVSPGTAMLSGTASKTAVTTVAATTAALPSVAAASTTTGTTIVHTAAPVAALPYSTAAMFAHGLSAAKIAVVTAVSSHPLVATAIVMGTACSVARGYIAGNNFSNETDR